MINIALSHMIIEQTKNYQHRIKYNPASNSFTETDRLSLFFERGCPYPYGWIEESGTPPEYHKDVILVSDLEYELGDRLEVKLIGIFKRADGDHKWVAVPTHRTVDDLFQLSEEELNHLNKLYPSIGEGEGWFGILSIVRY
ncbi:hypothetical protein QE109_16430 [Fusibacter bizertensis]|uniref:inorganic diphosphatase n=1 Tax=Fusibacter bizertensis TaxID=1488331 RepID=A0ABT6NH32_9FIRM|nr:inorganic diphosphatase [Fusibacter bizertensis]MDH8679747.1 hypothetical protein [Fusibacter bizertensis]